MLYQPNYTTEGAAPPKVQPNPDKVREIVEGFSENNIGVRAENKTIAGILAYLGDPFACVGIFESIDEMGLSEEGKGLYKDYFLYILEILNIEVEWESEYRLKQQKEGVIYATINGNYDVLWRSGGDLIMVCYFIESQLEHNFNDVPDDDTKEIQSLGESMVQIIEDEVIF